MPTCTTRLVRSAVSTILRPSTTVRLQRLFHVDVFAGVAGVDEHQRVPVVGRGDDYGVHFLVVEQPAVIRVPLGGGAGLAHGEVQVILAEVADRNGLLVAVLQEGIVDLVAPVAEPDIAHADAVIGAQQRANSSRPSGRRLP